MQKLEKSAMRYIQKININPEMSNNKLLMRIKRDSSVLEFGPASGAMTQVMNRELNCHVSIVELDEECFRNAMKYAVDGVCADIELYTWEEAFINQTFDYIVFADVLEHLKNPQKMLEEVEKFLKPDGSILISVPNIAHNSIIIQLLKNQFIYQNTGILDYTHIRHFTYSELGKMCVNSGYGIIYMDAVYISVGKNEFDISYSDIEPNVAEMLKKRPFGEVYQHIMEIKRKDYVEAHHVKIENCLGMPKQFTVKDFEKDEKEISAEETINKKIVDLLIEKPNYYFESNDEIARMRLEINDLYNAYPSLSDAVTLKKRIYDYQEEVREKNNHINILLVENENYQKTIQKFEKSNAELQRMLQSLEESDVNLQQMLQKSKKNNVDLQQMLQKSEKSNVDLQQMLQKSEKSNVDLQQMLQNLEKNSEESHQMVQGLEMSNSELRQTLQDMEKNNIDLQQMLRKMEKGKEDLQQIVKNKEGHIELLLEVERDYEREKKTHAYKIAKKMQKMADVMLPINSRRRFFLRVLYNVFRHPKLMFRVINPKRIKNYMKYMKKEGMEGVKKRYEEAVEIEKMHANPAEGLDLEIVSVENKSVGEIQNVEDFEKIILPVWKEPEVTVIIPVYNEFNYTYNCLKSIYKNTKNVAYEIIVANDCSTDITCEIEKIVENVRLVTTKKNLRFLLNCNNAAKYAKGKYILFLNNDTQVQDNWLEPLVSLIESNKSIGMVGSKLVYPDGYLQEAGGIVWKDASAWNYGNRKNPEDPEFNYVKEVDYISGASIMIRRELWEKIGGFDKRFVPAYYEDTDLAFEVRKRGYKVMYQPLSVVVHFEGVSNGTDVSNGVKHYQQLNYEKFYNKWKTELEAEHEVNAENVFTAKDRSNHKKHILVVDHYVPHHDQDAGGKCTYMYLKLFVKMGFKVTFIGDNFFKHEPYTTELNQMGIEVLYGNYYYNNWKEWLKENCHYFDYVYLQRPHISVKYIDLVKQYSHAKVFYFAHDLHHIREYREYEMTKDPEKLASSKHWKEIEYDLFQKADVGHVVGSYEQGIMQKVFPNKPVRNIPLYIYTELLDDINKDFSRRQDLLYVGGFGHPPNVDAVLWFAQKVFPRILEKYPEMKWHVVGGKVPKEVSALASDNIIIEGFLSDEDLEKLYRTCRMAVVPLRFGAGVKGKVVEAAYYQIPLVTTSIGAEGLSREEHSMLVEDGGIKMAELICETYTDYDKLRKMSDNGRMFIEKHFMLTEAERILRLDIDI